MVTASPDLFEGNRDFDLALPDEPALREIMHKVGGRVIYPLYAPDIPGDHVGQQRPGCHIITKMCQLAGVTGEVELKPYLYLTSEEKKAGAVAARQIVIQTSNLGGRWPARNKEWYPERFQAVVDCLKADFAFVQIGSPQDPALSGAVDLRGKTSLRQSAAILANALVFVGLEGFLMHLARAVDTRSVIVYGGKVLPSEIGYGANENLAVSLPCSPCWKYNACDYDRECMKRITVEEVVAAVRRQAARTGEPLVVDKAIIRHECAQD